VTAACWYVAGRVARRVDVPSGWRPLLVTAAWAAILSAAYLSARVDDPTNPLEHWEAYGTVKSELIPLLLCVTLYVLVSVCAWLVRHRREGR